MSCILIDPLTGSKTPAADIGSAWAALFPADRISKFKYTDVNGAKLTGTSALAKAVQNDGLVETCTLRPGDHLNPSTPVANVNAQVDACNMAITLVEATGWNPRTNKPLASPDSSIGWHAAMADQTCQTIADNSVHTTSTALGTLGFCRDYRGFHDPGMSGIDAIRKSVPDPEDPTKNIIKVVNVYEGDVSCGTLPQELNTIPKWQ